MRAMRDDRGGGGEDWSADEIRRVGYRAVDLIAEHLTGLPNGPVFRPVSVELAADLLDEPASRFGTSADAILDDFERRIAPHPFGNGHPRFYGWVNSPPTPIGIFADALAAAMNPSVAGGNHAAVWVEHAVVGWFKTLLGFPRDAMGMFVSGGSAAALTALAVARHATARKAGWDVRATGVRGSPASLIVYESAEAHGCNQKAIELLGLGNANLRVVESDAALRLSATALDRAIRADLVRGNAPMAVIATAGTVNTGAIDPLDEIADVCAEHGVWLHVDGAYGAPAILSDAYRQSFHGIARADSIAVDPHKWLYVPVDAGLVLVRDAAAMRDAFSLVPPYLRSDGNAHGVQGPPWFSEYGAEQTRPFRALKVWMALRHHGTEGYRRMIDHDLSLALRLAQLARASNDLECHEPQSLSIVCFRYSPAALRADDMALDAVNRALLTELQLGGRAFISSTVIAGRFWLRACIVNHRAHEGDIDAVVALVREIGARHVAPIAKRDQEVS
jgi:aromatic-L-amino-acid/L-tryptophan decarboxylase